MHACSEAYSGCASVIAEARGGLHIVEQSLWAALPAYLRRLNAALKRHCGRELPMGCAPLTFGSWMGGDRDGNPNVTAAVCHPCEPLPLRMHRLTPQSRLPGRALRARTLLPEPCHRTRNHLSVTHLYHLILHQD
jgi:hypothetical protein